MGQKETFLFSVATVINLLSGDIIRLLIELCVFKKKFDILVSLSIEKTLSKLPLVVTVILPSSLELETGPFNLAL